MSAGHKDKAGRKIKRGTGQETKKRRKRQLTKEEWVRKAGST